MQHKLSRRDAIKTTAAGLAGLAGCSMLDKPSTGPAGGKPSCTPGTSATPSKPESPGWIDAHVHVWTDDLKNYPISPPYTKDSMKLAHFTAEELFAHCEPCGVQRIDLIQMSYYKFDNRYMLDTMAKYPGRFAGTAIVDVTAADVADQMRRLAAMQVRAFRIYPDLVGQKPATWLKPEGYETVFAAGARLNTAMSCLIGPDSLPELDRMCTQHPDTPIIIDHLCRIGVTGKIEPQEVDALCRMSRHKRLMIKVGAFYALGRKQPPHDDLLPLIKRVTEAFGPQRCMWETDCPFQVVNGTYEASVAVIRDRCDFLGPADKRQILRGTAEAFFFN
jgi:predicted TIM-barrel fold metal-dependent hydrolase